MVQEVVIVAALRTPIGCFNGALAPLHAHEVLKTLQVFDLIFNKALVFTDITSQGILTVLSLSQFVTQLAAGVLKELLSSTGVAPEEVNEVILGQVGHKILTPTVDNDKYISKW